MTKPKAQTIQQKFGFLDEDLKKPKHDEIMKWLDSNVEKKLATWLDINILWSDKKVNEILQKVKNNQELRLNELQHELDKIKDQEMLIRKRKELQEVEAWIPCVAPPQKPPISIKGKYWEHPITSNKYIVGFIDLAVKYVYPNLYMSDLNGIYGSPRLNWKPKWEIEELDTWVYFEVKTEILNLGELIRQVNMYREYSKHKFFVVSPDDSNSAILKEQNISFIKYDLS